MRTHRRASPNRDRARGSERPAFDRQRFDRRGFALLAVLWIMVGVSALALLANLAARRAVATSANRLSLTRAQWRAEDCLERARAAIADVLAGRASWSLSAGSSPAGWGTLDRAVTRSPLLTEAHCDVALRAAGTAVDVNAADAEQLGRLFRAVGLPGPQSDSLTDAILDWRDADDIPRPLGAERAWYDAHHRIPPRNGSFADVRELRRVRGYDEALALAPSLDTLLSVEPGRIVPDRVPLAVLASLPGIGPEALARVVDWRGRGIPIGNWPVLREALSPDARAMLDARYRDLVRLTTQDPEAWCLTARAVVGEAPSLMATIEVQLVRAGDRAAVVRRHVWP